MSIRHLQNVMRDVEEKCSHDDMSLMLISLGFQRLVVDAWLEECPALLMFKKEDVWNKTQYMFSQGLTVRDVVPELFFSHRLDSDIDEITWERNFQHFKKDRMSFRLDNWMKRRVAVYHNNAMHPDEVSILMTAGFTMELDMQDWLSRLHDWSIDRQLHLEFEMEVHNDAAYRCLTNRQVSCLMQFGFPFEKGTHYMFFKYWQSLQPNMLLSRGTRKLRSGRKLKARVEERIPSPIPE